MRSAADSDTEAEAGHHPLFQFVLDELGQVPDSGEVPNKVGNLDTRELVSVGTGTTMIWM